MEKLLTQMEASIVLFNDFETLDVFGPVEILGRLNELFKISFYSEFGGPIKNTHGVTIDTLPLKNIIRGADIFIIPGGWGTRNEINNHTLLGLIKTIATASRYVLTVCTGSALLAKTGLLDHKRATSNKRAFDWVCSCGPSVNWIKEARWTADQNIYTSSGVSAGMDMTLGFLSDLYTIDFARKAARDIEYSWQEDKHHDEFCFINQ